MLAAQAVPKPGELERTPSIGLSLSPGWDSGRAGRVVLAPCGAGRLDRPRASLTRVGPLQEAGGSSLAGRLPRGGLGLRLRHGQRPGGAPSGESRRGRVSRLGLERCTASLWLPATGRASGRGTVPPGDRVQPPLPGSLVGQFRPRKTQTKLSLPSACSQVPRHTPDSTKVPLVPPPARCPAPSRCQRTRLSEASGGQLG